MADQTASPVTPPVTPPVGTGTGTGLESPPPSPQEITPERFNGLMGSFNKAQADLTREQAEAARLRTLLAQQIADTQDLKGQLSQGSESNNQALIAAQQQATAAETQVAELSAKVEALTALNTRLSFLVENHDLGDYAALIPHSGNLDELRRAAEQIRTARKKDTTDVRDHLVTPRGGGQQPRTPTTKMSAKEIETYLNGAKTMQEFEVRLAQVTTGGGIA